jgi:hypothetical protein
VFKKKKQERAPVVPEKIGRRIEALANPAFPIFPNPVSLLNKVRDEAGHAAYMVACEALFRALRRRLSVQPGHHVIVNVTAGYTLNIKPSLDAQDHIQYNGGRLHPLPA